MSFARPQFRLNAAEQLMAEILLGVWSKDGLATNEGEVMRLCLQRTFNHYQRSNKRRQIKFSVAGDVRSGRPRYYRRVSLIILNLSNGEPHVATERPVATAG